ncbi:SMP-30/gluconolactonase/LRE family protein [Bordetella bronchiseptica]|uniref:SMP-30/gluconolactonase/LRE family protein n=1 Tax=Bordetella bronchiseptica TaxID=518 RepID=UPI0005290489|nr:SMP-30/gluconolactonase/LRE family protein [Bordetella bronchiseptica]
MSQVQVLVAGGDTLGEVPLWSPSRKVLFWIDVRKPAVYAYSPDSGAVRSYPMPELVGSLCETSAGRLLLALKSGLFFLDPDSGALQPWFDPEPRLPNNRLNDGKCDRQGRFWVGSMNDGDRLPTGTLYSVDGCGKATGHFSGITIPNSLAWSPDGTKMYFADTPTKRIVVYDFDADDGVPHNPRTFVDMSGHAGRPDGATVDVDGCLWSAEVHAGRVARYTPDGRLDRAVELPVTGVTSCAFGGERFETLYVTTATQGLSEQARRDQPLAGALFAVDAGIAGLSETPFVEAS